ncbi:MAG: cupin domain-containing protein [Bdellovibrionota bacterium]
MSAINTQSFERAPSVLAGNDRFGENGLLIWGLLPLAIKLSGKDTGGELMAFEHRGLNGGGPPKHVHFEQDEWFYVIAGEFSFEVGDELLRLKTGDTLFAPRMVPHAWSHVGGGSGTLLTTVSPVKGFEEFILGTTKIAHVPEKEELEEIFERYGMRIVS